MEEIKMIENAIIKDVSISMGEHGCLTFWLTLDGGHWGVGYGGYCIGHGYLNSDNFRAESGAGLVAMMKIMDTVGVERWEDLKGKYVRAKVGLGSTPVRVIGNIIKDKWFNIEEFFENYGKDEK